MHSQLYCTTFLPFAVGKKVLASYFIWFMYTQKSIYCIDHKHNGSIAKNFVFSLTKKCIYIWRRGCFRWLNYMIEKMHPKFSASEFSVLLHAVFWFLATKCHIHLVEVILTLSDCILQIPWHKATMETSFKWLYSNDCLCTTFLLYGLCEVWLWLQHDVQYYNR